MKRIALFAAGLFWIPFAAPPGDAEETVFLISGDTLGYLSPCGCVKPMLGGIRRRAEALRTLSEGKAAVILDTGGFAAGADRQSALKAEALAEAFDRMNMSAVNLCASDSDLGQGTLLMALQLSGGRVVTASLARSESNPFAATRESGGCLIAGVTANPEKLARALRERPVNLKDAARALVREATAGGLAAVLLLDGDLKLAREIARENPSLALIVYRSAGSPPDKPEFEGRTALLSPGSKGTHLVRILRRQGKWTGYFVVPLGPEFKDHDAVNRVFRRYLARVEEERLLEKAPRSQRADFAGSVSCRPCHEKAYDLWAASRHGKALATLEAEGHALDPDCVGCHVVGLEFVGGFVSRAKTPALADVGCESCHGPGAAHAGDPYGVKLGKAGQESCMRCHNAEHSPRFDFSTYWPLIRHE